MLIRLTHLVLVGLLLVACGCASSASTVFLRDEANMEWQTTKCIRGIPITLKVPTHVKVYVYEKHFLEFVEKEGDRRVEYLKLPVVLRDFSQDFIYTEKIIMVDFKRPAAGEFNLDVELTDEQYIKKIQHDVTDETIQRVTELAKTLAPSGLFTPAAARSPGKGEVDSNLKEIQSVVAVGVFEIDSPTFEQEMAEFINCHINRAHDAWMIPPGVNSYRRLPLDPKMSEPGPQLCPSGSCNAITISPDPGFPAGAEGIVSEPLQ